MALIPDSVIEQIRESINIVDFIGRFVRLKRSGRNYMGLCPFHREKTPSFSVSPEKQIFHCFGCGVGGNIFTFLMKYENITFYEAVQRLAKEAGISLPRTKGPSTPPSANEALLKANQIAASFYQRQLQQAPEDVKAYLRERGLTDLILEQFGIGYAPPGWDSLLQHLEHFHYPLDPYLTLGLLIPSEKSGRPYDRFRNRIIFPIYSIAGQIVGFGARTLENDPNVPKYVNSPESPIYQKSRILFGLYQAREAIREEGYVIFVEGYMDLLQLFQHGIRNVVATSGTALTPQHARLIRRFTQKVYLCYDSDTAGINAAVRGGEVLFQNDVEVHVLLLPEGEDPDSFVRTYGPEAFQQKLGSAVPYLEFRLQYLEKKYNMNQASGRSQAIEDILEMLVAMKNQVQQSFFINQIASRWDVPPTVLMNQLLQKKKARRKWREAEAEETAPSPPQASQTKKLIFQGAWGAEKDTLALLMNFYDDLNDIIFEYIEDADFQNPEFRNVYILIRKWKPSSPSPIHQYVLDRLEDEQLRNLLTEALQKEYQNPAAYLADCLRRLKTARLQTEIKRTSKEIKSIPKTDSRYHEMRLKLNELTKQLQQWMEFQLD